MKGRSAMSDAIVGGSAQCTWDQPAMPFVDFTAQGQTLSVYSKKTGIKCFALGFVVAKKTGKFKDALSWGGYYDAEKPGDDKKYYKKDQIDEFKKIGGVPVISFGGQNNLLPDVVFSGDELCTHYKNVIGAYDVDRIDFDIEGKDDQIDDVLNRNPNLVKCLLEWRPTLKISYTLAINPDLSSGVDGWSAKLLQKLADAKVTPDLVNAMTMYMWQKPTDAWESAKGILQGLNKQLCSIYKFTETEAWCRIGCCPKYGDNGPQSSPWTLDDQGSLCTFAKNNNLGCCSGWNTNDDSKNNYEYENKCQCR
jgi:chitinase